MMGQHSLVLLTILIAYLAFSFGVMIPYKNNTIVKYSSKENISITCADDSDNGRVKYEVTWTESFTMGANYSIKVEAPHRKLLQIKNASVYNTGVYECRSKKNTNEFMRIFVSCDTSCFDDVGATRHYSSVVSADGKVQYVESYRSVSDDGRKTCVEITN